MSSSLQIRESPDLRGSAVILAFEGWNDAGESATSAVSYLGTALRATPFAEIDPDDFYDFTVQRPEVVLESRPENPSGRRIEWPKTEFRWGSLEGTRNFVVGIGVEPHLRWKAYSDYIVDLVRHVDVSRVVLLGSYLADVVYSRPVLVTGVSSRNQHFDHVDADASSYEGPTGIVGVLSERLEREGHEVTCLWAGLPHYITASPNPRGALALLQKLSAILEFKIDEGPLEKEAAEFEKRISKMVAADEELSTYVRQLKRREFAQ